MATPSAEVVAQHGLDTSLAALAKWAGMSDESFVAIAKHLGFPDNLEALKAINPRILAVATSDEFQQAVDGVEGITFFTKMAARNMCTTAVALFRPAPALPAQQQIAAIKDKEGSATGRKLKMSNLVDPVDETDVAAATKSDLDTWYANYKALKFGPPLPRKEPTPDQIAAMHQRVVVHLMEPYADFSILTPYGRRKQKQLRHRSWVPQGDGTYQPVEVPGPDSLPTWEACYGVWEVIMFMLRIPGETPDLQEPVLTPIASEAYYEAFRELAREHPECWHLCCRAEDRCRAEHIPRVGRRLLQDLGRQPSWSEVFIAAANDSKFWDQEVRNPALGFLARGNKRGPAVEDTPSEPSVPPPPRPHSQQPPRKKGRGQQQQPKKSPKGPGVHPKKDKQGRYITTREGTEICFRWSQGGEGSCSSPCQHGRAHVCQRCLQPHRTGSEACTVKT